MSVATAYSSSSAGISIRASVGDPYFYRGHYVVRSYNRFGHVVFVEINPYTGGFIGEIRL